MQVLTEERAALELMAYEACCDEVCIDAKLCHSEANLADSMAKATASGPIRLYMTSRAWAIGRDES